MRLSINLSLFPLRNILVRYKNAVNWHIKTVINALSENIKIALSFLELRYNCVSSVPELNFSDICLHLFILSRVDKP